MKTATGFCGRAVGWLRRAVRVRIPLWLFLLILSAVVALRLYVFLPMLVISDSMAPTMRRGDICLVYRLAYRRRRPRLGEVIAFYNLDRKEVWGKRVVAGPGDVVQVRAGLLWRNGEPVNEPYVRRDADAPAGSTGHALRARDLYLSGGELPDPEAAAAPPPDYGPYRVPNGHFFVLGDNRDHSEDSREWGPLHAELMLGQGLCVFWPRRHARPLR